MVHGKEKLQAATGEASTRYQKKCFHNKGGQTQTRAQRGADFILGDTQDSAGQSPKLPAQVESALSGELDQMTNTSLFQTKLFYDFVIPHFLLF